MFIISASESVPACVMWVRNFVFMASLIFRFVRFDLRTSLSYLTKWEKLSLWLAARGSESSGGGWMLLKVGAKKYSECCYWVVAAYSSVKEFYKQKSYSPRRLSICFTNVFWSSTSFSRNQRIVRKTFSSFSSARRLSSSPCKSVGLISKNSWHRQNSPLTGFVFILKN